MTQPTNTPQEGKGEIRERCLGCGYEIDTDTCHCGIGFDDHNDEEHQFVPAGCACLYDEHKGRDEWRAFIRTLANQKLKKGMERALECKPPRKNICGSSKCDCCQRNAGYHEALNDFSTAIREEIENLTQPKE